MPPRPSSAVTTSSSEEGKAAEVALTKAAQLELSGQYDTAFRLYLCSAQTLLHLTRASSSTSPILSPAEQARYKLLAKRALDRAEKIKAHKQDVGPVARSRLAKESQAAVLDRSSLIGGTRYPLWTSASLSAASSTSTEPFQDPDGLLPLSDAQHSALSTWIKPDIPIQSFHLEPNDLFQELITDCSVVASLVVCVAHNRQFGTNLGVCCVFPQDSQGTPVRSESGQYEVRLILNGCARRVAVDSLLPVRESGCLLCVSTRGNKALWPSLLEKAYLKVGGGYDFEGSNGAIDLHAITGWIPEHLRIADAKFQREKTWNRILHAFQAGHVLMTAGTGRSPGTFGPHHLTPFHAYAVVGLREEEEGRERTIDLWNPWGKRPSGEAGFSDGPIRMQWDHVCGIFDSIYLNWDPGIFDHKEVVHSVWQPNKAQDGEEVWTSNHQYNISFPNGSAEETEVWVLLSRHTAGKDEDQCFIAGHVFHAAEADSTSVSRPALEATYTDSPHVLVRTSCLPEENSLSVITSRHGTGGVDTAYSLSVHSSSSFVISEPAQVYSFSQWVEGVFTSATAGGNAWYPTFMRNPQYALDVKLAADCALNTNNSKLRLSVHGSKDLPLHVQIVWGGGVRVFDVRTTKVVKDSGTYNYGFGLCEVAVKQGTYTVIVSSFEPGVLGQYKLQVECADPFEIKPIPQEGAGMFSKRVTGLWCADSTPPTFAITLDKPTILTARLQLSAASSSSPVKLFLNIPSTESIPEREIATSGDFGESTAGAAIRNVQLATGTYVLVPSIISSRPAVDFIVQVYSSACSIKVRQV